MITAQTLQKFNKSVIMCQQKGEPMKITRILGTLIILLILSSCRSVVAPEFDLNPIVKKVENKNSSFSQLVSEADLVLEVNVLDKLNLTNSTIKNEEDFYALRSVEVVNVLENNLNYKKTEKGIVIKEAAALDKENVYYTSNHMPFEEGTKYILFLKQIKDNVFEVLDGDNAVVNIGNVTSNQNVEVMVNTLFKYLNPTINGKGIDYVNLTLVESPKNVKFERYTVKLRDFDIPIRLGIDINTKKEYLMISTFTFQLESPQISKIR